MLTNEQIQILIRALDLFEGHEDVSMETSSKCPEIEEFLISQLSPVLTNVVIEDIEIMCCPRCGSGDVSFCSISVRPHCNECKLWGAINWNGTKTDSIEAWNESSKEAGR